MSLRSIILNTSLVTVLSAAAKVLGFVREQAMASALGAGALTDAYVVALTIPTVSYAFLSTILLNAFIPVYSGCRARGEHERAARLAQTVAGCTLIASLLIALAGIALAPVLVRVLAPGFPSEVADLTTALTRLLFVGTGIATLGALGGAALNSHGIFSLPAAAPAVQNTLAIAGVVFLTRRLSVWGIAYGTVAGAALGLAVQLGALKRTPLCSVGRVDLGDSAAVQVLRMSVPLVLGAILAQSQTIVEKVLASGLPQGSLSALNYATKLALLPIATVVAAVSTVVFPRLGEQYGRKDCEGLARTVAGATLAVSAIVIPVAFAFAALSVPTIRVAYQRGAFGEESVITAARSLMFYAGWVVFSGISSLFAKVCYAMQDSLTPLVASALNAVITVAAAYVLVRPMAAAGLALAASLGALAGAALLLHFLLRRLEPDVVASMLSSHAKVLTSAAIMALGCVAALRQWPIADGSLSSAARFILIAGGGAAFYVACLAALGVLPLSAISRMVRQRT